MRVKRLLLRESQVQPLLLVFEDLHWIDCETQALLDSLVESLRRMPSSCLVNYRPDSTSTLGRPRPTTTSFGSTRFRPESARELLDALLGDDGGRAPLKAALVERTRAIRSSWRRASGRWSRPGRSPASAAPTAWRAAPGDRRSRPPCRRSWPRASTGWRAEKRLLQAAAVIGKDVPFALLQAIADEQEQELRARLHAAGGRVPLREPALSGHSSTRSSTR